MARTERGTPAAAAVGVAPRANPNPNPNPSPNPNRNPNPNPNPNQVPGLFAHQQECLSARREAELARGRRHGIFHAASRARGGACGCTKGVD